MSKRLRKKKVLREIEHAFKGVTLGDGVSLHETVEVDDYRRVLPGSTTREIDEISDWQQLVGSDNILNLCWSGGMTFMDGKGFKFHIPAYLVMDIRTHKLGDISSSMIFNLTKPSKSRAEGFKLFNQNQRRAVFNAVLYLHEFEVTPLDDEELAGLYEYWA